MLISGKQKGIHAGTRVPGVDSPLHIMQTTTVLWNSVSPSRQACSEWHSESSVSLRSFQELPLPSLFLLFCPGPWKQNRRQLRHPSRLPPRSRFIKHHGSHGICLPRTHQSRYLTTVYPRSSDFHFRTGVTSAFTGTRCGLGLLKWLRG